MFDRDKPAKAIRRPRASTLRGIDYLTTKLVHASRLKPLDLVMIGIDDSDVHRIVKRSARHYVNGVPRGWVVILFEKPDTVIVSKRWPHLLKIVPKT